MKTLDWSRLGAVLALSAAVLVSVSPAAHAEDPVELRGAYVLDSAGAISGDETRVQTALDSLYDAAGIQLFVVYVDSFSNPSDPVSWADTTADNNGLGTKDLLLAVAVTDRQYALSVAPDFPLSDSQLDSVETAIEGALKQNQWADAAINGAAALQSASTGSSGGISPAVPIVGGVAVVGVGVFVYSRIRKRNKNGSVTSQPQQMTQQELDRRAGSLLVQLDDSLKTSEQELGFAVAQFGDAATADFTATLKSAHDKVAQAFALKQKLDDAEPDTEEQKRAWTTEIIQLCEAADAELDAQADAFDQLRQLEKNAPQALTEVQAAAAAAKERAVTAKSTLATLSSSYTPAAIKPVSENLDQAAKLLDFADTAAQKATAAIAAGTQSEAAIAVRTAQASVGQATQLFDAIDTLAGNLGEAGQKLEAVVADTTQDIAEARALPQDDGSANLAPAIAAAEAALTVAKTPGDPIASLSQLEQANAALEEVFTGVRDQQTKVAHARTQLDASIAAARAQITSAAEFITTRRGGIGESARTRVSEADRHLSQALALATSDPVAALAEAQQANQLAATAFELAQRDVSSYTSQQSYGNQDLGGPDLGGLLGGLIGGMLGSGGGSRSSSWGGSSGSSRSSWGGGGSRSGSFGGSSRSSGGGRSGGGRSRGGRF